ncbi:MAG: stage II sporulation protein R [Candidatus Flemingiibacterium sp.]
MNSKQFLVFLLTFSILTAFALPFAAVIPSEEEAAVYDSVIRLHVLANSDSDEDQALKLKVRDGILSTAAGLVEGCTDFESAREALAGALPELRDAALGVLRREGSDYDVRVTLTREEYPTREYRGVTLPAGEYTSLRVLIGEAAGHNWWCVLFPQLCVTTASEGGEVGDFTILDDTEPLVEAGLTPSQIELITGDSPRVTVKFRLLEWLKSLRLQ